MVSPNILWVPGDWAASLRPPLTHAIQVNAISAHLMRTAFAAGTVGLVVFLFREKVARLVDAKSQ